MKRNNDILIELEQIGCSFDKNAVVPLFEVPANYFETLPNLMLSIATDSLAEKSALLPQMPTHPYQVPEHYFENLTQTVLEHVKAADAVMASTAIQGLSKENVYTVPAGYFENLAASVLQKIQEEPAANAELADSPLLAALKNSNPYSTAPVEVRIPNFMPKHAAVVEQNSEAMPIAVKKSLRWAKWAAAASLALFFSVGAAWLEFGGTKNKQPNHFTSDNMDAKAKAQALLASIPDDVVEKYVDIHADEFDEFLLESKVNSLGEKATNNLEKALQDVSDEDIKAYLNTY